MAEDTAQVVLLMELPRVLVAMVVEPLLVELVAMPRLVLEAMLVELAQVLLCDALRPVTTFKGYPCFRSSLDLSWLFAPSLDYRPRVFPPVISCLATPFTRILPCLYLSSTPFF